MSGQFNQQMCPQPKSGIFSADNANPLGVGSIRRSGQIAPQAFDLEAAGDQFGTYGFGSVILEPVAVNADFAVTFDDDVLIKE